MTGMVPSKQVRLELAMLLIEISYIPRMQGEMGTREQIMVLQKVCQAVVARTGFTMFTATLRAMWTATQQADILLETPLPVDHATLTIPHVSIFAMNPSRTWAPLHSILDPPISRFCSHDVGIAVELLKDLLQHKGPYRE